MIIKREVNRMCLEGDNKIHCWWSKWIRKGEKLKQNKEEKMKENNRTNNNFIKNKKKNENKKNKNNKV